MASVETKDFYETLIEYGEDILFECEINGIKKEIKQKASIALNRLNKAIATTDGSHWYVGNSTFDNINQQVKLVGCYFKRATLPNAIYMLAAVSPDIYTEKIGNVFCVECNEKIDVISHYKEDLVDGEFVLSPVYIYKDIPVYTTAYMVSGKNSSAGIIDSTSYFVTVPSRFPISSKNTIMRNEIVFDEETNSNVLKKVPYHIESADNSMSDLISDTAGTVGTCRFLIKEAVNA